MTSSTYTTYAYACPPSSTMGMRERTAKMSTSMIHPDTKKVHYMQLTTHAAYTASNDVPPVSWWGGESNIWYVSRLVKIV